ncbi:hypothetical protein PAXINDRAFT_22298 [Paxillus involutus ATCC 200175]|uniref:Uncharacterized protein n=1 Tax=Paxillus involutus ATCC 200175 TaxID=664439 RepID=A0A0C9SLH1_PAXIN|nr:hypothetical protein PAXINDRAFT_22298 [Paxillus involutus ATCC 200175]
MRCTLWGRVQASEKNKHPTQSSCPSRLARTLGRSHSPKPPTGTRRTCDDWKDDRAGECRKGPKDANGVGGQTKSTVFPGSSFHIYAPSLDVNRSPALLHNIRDEYGQDVASISRPADEAINPTCVPNTFGATFFFPEEGALEWLPVRGMRTLGERG